MSGWAKLVHKAAIIQVAPASEQLQARLDE